MIAFLRGKIKVKAENYLIVDVNNVGYQVFVIPNLAAGSDIGQVIEVYTHQYVREDTLNLYGFSSMEELELFELLLSISGIGPKSAIGILSIAKVNDIKQSIARGDSVLLTKVSGIGRKTAERVILELREKMDGLDFSKGKSAGGQLLSSDEIDALVALGYSFNQARQALNQVDHKIKDSGERVKLALKILGR